MSSPKYDNILDECWNNDIFIYPLHLGGDKYFIEVFKKGIRKVDEVQRNLEKTKIKILEYYCFFYGRLK